MWKKLSRKCRRVCMDEAGERLAAFVCVFVAFVNRTTTTTTTNHNNINNNNNNKTQQEHTPMPVRMLRPCTWIDTTMCDLDDNSFMFVDAVAEKRGKKYTNQ